MVGLGRISLALLTILFIGTSAPALGQARRPPAAIQWSSVPQSGAVTLRAKDMPAKQLFDDIARQSGFKVEWRGPQEKTFTLTADRAPLLEVLANLAKQVSGGVQEYQSADGLLFVIPDGPAIKAYQVQGPLLLAWYDLATVTHYNFQDPSKPIQSTKYRLGIIKDPAAHIESSVDKPLRDLPVTFIPSSGARLVLQSDHARNVFTSGVPTWEFAPRPDLTGSAVTIEVTVPVSAPTSLGRASLPWRSGSTARASEVDVTLEAVKTEKKSFGKPHEVDELTATFKIIQSAAPSMAAAPTAMLPAHLAAHEVHLVGTDGTRIRGTFTAASGMSGPPLGYRYNAKFKAPSPAWSPKEIAITWAGKFQHLDVPFRLDKAPLSRN